MGTNVASATVQLRVLEDPLGVCRNENFLYAESITYGQTPVADGL